MLIQELRNQFPSLADKVYGKPLVYFDNAATSLRPIETVKRLSHLSLHVNANIHRAVHSLASAATEEFEKTRDAVKDYIGASSREEIIFTSGTTASINLVASSFGERFFNEGDNIIISEAEHHSNIVPWQLICERKHVEIKVLPVDDSGHLKVDLLPSLLNDKTKLVAVAHISNVLGLVNPIDEIVRIAHEKGVPVLVDGAQGIVHQVINVEKTNCDFYAFSGHKCYAATGTGVLYGKKKWLDLMPPYMGGGEMIGSVSFAGSTYAPLPGKFEAGTQNINAIPTLRTGIDLLKQFSDKSLANETEAVKSYLLDKLTSDDRITLFGVPHRTSEKVPVFSFCVKGVHHEDLALILDKLGIAVRSGQMCAEPLMDRMGVTGMVRASLAPYNTMEEAEYFVKSLDRAIKMLS